MAGLVVAGVFLHDRVLMDKLRSTAFALLTPFFFLRAGAEISAPALVTGAGIIGLLLLVKLAAKMIGVWPVATAFRLPPRERTYSRVMTVPRSGPAGSRLPRRRSTDRHGRAAALPP